MEIKLKCQHGGIPFCCQRVPDLCCTQTSLGHVWAVAGHLMPGRLHSNINWVCPRVDTWSSSGLKKFGIERRQITRELQSPPQMPSAVGSNSSGTAGACRNASQAKCLALAQSLNSSAPLRFNEPWSRWHFGIGLDAACHLGAGDWCAHRLDATHALSLRNSIAVPSLTTAQIYLLTQGNLQ